MATATGTAPGEATLESNGRHATLQQLLEREQQVLRARTGALRATARGETQETTDVEERSEVLVDFGVGVAALKHRTDGRRASRPRCSDSTRARTAFALTAAVRSSPAVCGRCRSRSSVAAARSVTTAFGANGSEAV